MPPVCSTYFRQSALRLSPGSRPSSWLVCSPSREGRQVVDDFAVELEEGLGRGDQDLVALHVRERKRRGPVPPLFEFLLHLPYLPVAAGEGRVRQLAVAEQVFHPVGVAPERERFGTEPDKVPQRQVRRRPDVRPLEVDAHRLADLERRNPQRGGVNDDPLGCLLVLPVRRCPGADDVLTWVDPDGAPYLLGRGRHIGQLTDPQFPLRILHRPFDCGRRCAVEVALQAQVDLGAYVHRRVIR